MQSLIVSGIFIYPVKSLGGISLQSAEVLPKGFAMDRRWMLVDENGGFITQRQHPVLSLFKPVLSGNKVSFSIQYKHDIIEIPMMATGSVCGAGIWGDFIEVVEVGTKISEWFSNHLQSSCRLVQFPEGNPRPVDPDYAVGPDNQTSLSDGFPILAIGQASLDDLNSRLEFPVPMNRFRPNIVFTGGVPFEEDVWKKFRVGDIPMAGVKPCGRCVMTTIDQESGVAGKEPLATLSSYRKVGNKVLFGQNVIPLKGGVISIGDEIILQ